MVRSKWKLFYFNQDILNDEKTLVSNRNSTILPIFLKKTVAVHNGKTWRKVFIKPSMIGFKFGDFAFTRKHTQKKLKKK